jgi:hypothetical protein
MQLSSTNRVDERNRFGVHTHLRMLKSKVAVQLVFCGVVSRVVSLHGVRQIDNDPEHDEHAEHDWPTPKLRLPQHVDRNQIRRKRAEDRIEEIADVCAEIVNVLENQKFKLVANKQRDRYLADSLINVVAIRPHRR